MSGHTQGLSGAVTGAVTGVPGAVGTGVGTGVGSAVGMGVGSAVGMGVGSAVATGVSSGVDIGVSSGVRATGVGVASVVVGMVGTATGSSSSDCLFFNALEASCLFCLDRRVLRSRLVSRKWRVFFSVAFCLFDFFVGQTHALAEGEGTAEIELDCATALVVDGRTLGTTEIVLEDIATSTDELELGARKTLVEEETRLMLRLLENSSELAAELLLLLDET